MNEYQAELTRIISSGDLHNLEAQLNLSDDISEKNLSDIFIDSIYLAAVVRLVLDDHWIQSKKAKTELQFGRFVKKFFQAELKPLLFLHEFFQNSSVEELQGAVKALEATEKLLIRCIKSKSSEFQKKFLQMALPRMSDLFELEHQLNQERDDNLADAKLCLYRSFDALDQIFELDYLLNEVPAPHQKERLYEGAGVGVQSSYATILLALRYLNLPKGSRFIDLGSGYGRVGLVVGLLRPDLQFTGYEFVPERVAIANKASVQFQLQQHIDFATQDLSAPDFKIPVADTYYIFDSFTDETYVAIMEQLQQMTLQKRITVVTKGNARLWMDKKHWSAPQEFNGGNLCFFRSSARPRSI